jgi:general secretion pathway protein K
MTILIVTLLSILIISIHSRSYLAIARAKNSVNSLKSYYIMRSGASAAMGFLERDAKESNIDTFSENWAQGIRDFPVGDGIVSVAISDESSKFNINTMINSQGHPVEKAIVRFGRLLRELDIDEGFSLTIAEWLKKNRKDFSYTFRDISELPLVSGFTPETLKKIEKHITVYTDRRNERNININTVGIEVLRSLSSELTETLTIAIMDYRKEHPFKEIADLKKVQGIDDVILSSFSDVIDVKSSVFTITSESKVSNTVKRGVAIVNRGMNTVKIVVWREE